MTELHDRQITLNIHASIPSTSSSSSSGRRRGCERAMSSPLLLKASAIAATDEEVKRHSINPKGVRHSRSQPWGSSRLDELWSEGRHGAPCCQPASIHSRLTD